MTLYLQPSSAAWRTRAWSWPAFWKAFWLFPAIGAAGGLVAGFMVAGTSRERVELRLLFSAPAALAGALIGWPRSLRAAREPVVADYTEAIRRDPAQPIAYFNRGQVYLWILRDYRRAIMDFDEAIRLEPNYPSAHLARVNAFAAMGRVRTVIAEYTEAIRLDPGNAMAYCCRATAYNALGQPNDSIPDATEAIRIAPDLYLGYDARGYGILQRGRATRSKADLEQAVADFTEGIRLNPEDADCYWGRAMAYRALGDGASATQDEEWVRQQVPRQ